jgi:hypothetical protein
MSAIKGNLRAIKSHKDMVNRSIAGCVARSQGLSQLYVKVGVRQVVFISSVAQQGAYQHHMMYKLHNILKGLVCLKHIVEPTTMHNKDELNLQMPKNIIIHQ